MKFRFFAHTCKNFSYNFTIKNGKSGLKNFLQLIRILIPQMLNSNELIKLKGAIFCHINKIAWLVQFKFSAMLGNQKCTGAIPSFMANASRILTK